MLSYLHDDMQELKLSKHMRHSLLGLVQHSHRPESAVLASSRTLVYVVELETDYVYSIMPL